MIPVSVSLRILSPRKKQDRVRRTPEELKEKQGRKGKEGEGRKANIEEFVDGGRKGRREQF